MTMELPRSCCFICPLSIAKQGSILKSIWPDESGLFNDLGSRVNSISEFFDKISKWDPKTLDRDNEWGYTSEIIIEYKRWVGNEYSIEFHFSDGCYSCDYQLSVRIECDLNYYNAHMSKTIQHINYSTMDDTSRPNFIPEEISSSSED